MPVDRNGSCFAKSIRNWLAIWWLAVKPSSNRLPLPWKRGAPFPAPSVRLACLAKIPLQNYPGRRVCFVPSMPLPAPTLCCVLMTSEHEAPSGCTLAHTAGLGMALSKCSKDSSCMRIRGHLSSVHTASAVFGVALSVLLGSRELQPSSLHFTPFQWMLFLYSRLYPPYLYCSTASRLNPSASPPKHARHHAGIRKTELL